MDFLRDLTLYLCCVAISLTIPITFAVACGGKKKSADSSKDDSKKEKKDKSKTQSSAKKKNKKGKSISGSSSCDDETAVSINHMSDMGSAATSPSISSTNPAETDGVNTPDTTDATAVQPLSESKLDRTVGESEMQSQGVTQQQTPSKMSPRPKQPDSGRKKLNESKEAEKTQASYLESKE